MTEATPDQQAQEQSTVEDIRLIMHKDNEGNVITDPDRSNPTRYRLERPLDTIRQFHAAAEGTSSRRSSYGSRPVSQVGFSGDNRRASYYSQNGYSPQRPRGASGGGGGGGYYRNSSYGAFSPQGTLEESPGSAQMYARPPVRQQQHTYPYAGAHGPAPNGYPNGHTNGYQNGDSPVSAHGYQHSYDAMTSGSEDYNKSTNPSSQNSSYDQLHQLRTKTQQEYPPENPYANEIQFNQVSPTEPFSPQNLNDASQEMAPPNVRHPGYTPPVVNNPRQPIKLDTGVTAGEITPPSSPRKSWIKRRFSRKER